MLKLERNEMTIIYREIADFLKQSEQTIKQLKKLHPEKLELYKLGALCKKYGITEDDLVKILDIKNKSKDIIEPRL